MGILCGVAYGYSFSCLYQYIRLGQRYGYGMYNDVPGDTVSAYFGFKFDNYENRYTVPAFEIAMASYTGSELVLYLKDVLSADKAMLAKKAEDALKSVLG